MSNPTDKPTQAMSDERAAFENAIRENLSEDYVESALSKEGEHYAEYATVLAWAIWRDARRLQNSALATQDEGDGRGFIEAQCVCLKCGKGGSCWPNEVSPTAPTADAQPNVEQIIALIQRAVCEIPASIAIEIWQVTPLQIMWVIGMLLKSHPTEKVTADAGSPVEMHAGLVLPKAGEGPITDAWCVRRGNEDLETWSLRVSFRKACEEMDAIREALGVEEDCDYGEMIEKIEALRDEAPPPPALAQPSEAQTAERVAALEEAAKHFDGIAKKQQHLPITPEFVARQIRALKDPK